METLRAYIRQTLDLEMKCRNEKTHGVISGWVIGLFVALGRITSRGVRAIVIPKSSDGHLLGKMVAFGRFQV